MTYDRTLPMIIHFDLRKLNYVMWLTIMKLYLLLSYLKAKDTCTVARSNTLVLLTSNKFLLEPAVFLKYWSGQGENASEPLSTFCISHGQQQQQPPPIDLDSPAADNCFPSSLCMTWLAFYWRAKPAGGVLSMYVRLDGRAVKYLTSACKKGAYYME